jgi:hypothetical protein
LEAPEGVLQKATYSQCGAIFKERSGDLHTDGFRIDLTYWHHRRGQPRHTRQTHPFDLIGI